MPGKQTVAFAVASALREIGVRHVFGVPSGGWVDYMEALRATADIEFVLTTHEGGAGMMADICGRQTGAPGVCFGTFGPGATNLATGVGGALLDRSPLIALTDEMPAAMRGRVSQMGIDHQALFRPITKHTTRLTPEAPRAMLFDAARLALAEQPGPVHVGLPVGMSAQTAGPETVRFTGAELPRHADPASVTRAIGLFEKARRPVLAVGLGAVRAGLRDRIRALAEKHNLPVVLTPMAKGMLAEDHRCYAGVVFHALSDIVGQTHQMADSVVAIGYDPVEFNFESWMPRVPLVNIDTVAADIDPAVYPDVVNVTGAIANSVEKLVELTAKDAAWDFRTLGERRNEIFARLAPPPGSFGPRAVLSILRDVLPPDGIMTCDVGAHTHLIGQAWRTPAPGLQIMTNGWSTMGFGIPSAIAAKLVHRDKPVCTVAGDGGFLMTAGEIATAIRCKLNVVIVLLTDNDLALIRIKQERKGNPVYGTPVRERGTIGGDNIFGAPVRVASDAASFRKHLDAAFAADGPVIVEAIVDSREYDSLVLKKDK
ncbi:MAG TPA: thiamine pyrophosphate-binding protein [Micropepsaceae bacterium]|nr:thiamine pyrophosphate-binding protein [Micropepsaceae bacterium]